MLELWVIMSMIAMLANFGKVLLVKKKCQQIDSWLLVFYARLVSALVLLLLLYFLDYKIPTSITFWGVTLVTALLTMAASILYVESIKKGQLSVVVPIQASVPLFMIMVTTIAYHEMPNRHALLSILVIVISIGYILVVTTKSVTLSKSVNFSVLLSLVAAALFGISTVLDRVAIATVVNGAVVYSAYWNLISALLMVPQFLLTKKAKKTNFAFRAPIAIYSFLTLMAFVFQQLGVQYSLAINNGVTYVKTIVMIHIALVALAGIFMLKEKTRRGVLVAGLITLMASVSLLYSST
jgi:drug/metabolite transporter (DMT)-like permease